MQGCVHGHGRSTGTAATSAVAMGASTKSSGGTEAVSARQSILLTCIYYMKKRERIPWLIIKLYIPSTHPKQEIDQS